MDEDEDFYLENDFDEDESEEYDDVRFRDSLE